MGCDLPHPILSAVQGVAGGAYSHAGSQAPAQAADWGMPPTTPQSINAAAAFSNNSSYSTAFLPFVDLAAPTSQPLPAARVPPDSQQEEASCPLTQVG